MKKTAKIAAITAVTAILLSLTALVLAGHGFGPFGDNPAIVKKLEITPEQQKKIEAIRTETGLKRVDIEASLKKLRIQQQQALKTDDLDKAAVLKLTEEIGKQEIELKKLGISTMLDCREVLTLEQREKAKDMRAHFQNRIQAGQREGRGRHFGAERGPRGPQFRKDCDSQNCPAHKGARGKSGVPQAEMRRMREGHPGQGLMGRGRRGEERQGQGRKRRGNRPDASVAEESAEEPAEKE